MDTELLWAVLAIWLCGLLPGCAGWARARSREKELEDKLGSAVCIAACLAKELAWRCDHPGCKSQGPHGYGFDSECVYMGCSTGKVLDAARNNKDIYIKMHTFERRNYA